jgi:2-amino-4-hydroxy-6-hydroxymethyldihydropteridine diphosphokinase
MNTAYVALGANLGDPTATVLAAFGALANLPDSRVVHGSSLYRTAPVGIAAQPDFINAVAELETTLAPEALLDALFEIEERFGRVRAEKNGPRTLDLDLLLYNDQLLALPRLTLPHPRLHLRAFALLPLAELAPNLVIPGRGSVAAWLPAVANQGIVRL